MKTNEATGSSTEANVRTQSHAHSFAKVLDGRKHPVRGLWVRNGRFYAQLAIEDPNTGSRRSAVFPS